MKTGQVEILDNSATEQDFDDKYKGLPNTLKRVLILYLKQNLRATTAIKELEKSAIVRKDMDWRTLNNSVDCEIFTMRHTETYKGKTPWTCGLVKEIGQQTQLHLLRHRYLIILSDYNLQRQKIIRESKAFDKRLDRDAYMQNLDLHITSRLNACFGKQVSTAKFGPAHRIQVECLLWKTS